MVTSARTSRVHTEQETALSALNQKGLLGHFILNTYNKIFLENYQCIGENKAKTSKFSALHSWRIVSSHTAYSLSVNQHFKLQSEYFELGSESVKV